MKAIISFLLKTIPRKYLQLISHYVLRVVALFYKGKNVFCPVCDSQYSVFLPYGRVGRSNALCPSCLSLERHRLIWLYLDKETSFFTEKAKMLHIAPEYCFIERFEKIQGLDYITADIESPLAKVKMDVHEIPFEAESFDIVFCNHVLEHVNDDRKAMSEIHRVLKKGGWAILQIPLFYPLAEITIEDPTITDAKVRERRFGQDDHVRMYGLDYTDRLKKAGFQVRDNYLSKLEEKEILKYGLDKKEILFVVDKA
ncbi:MAG: SAM-dependent methyltransferase [Cyclobacteriaceae bacterium]